jgi:NADH:ubiquinone oxidoreductase subunit 4 (subunit M)
LMFVVFVVLCYTYFKNKKKQKKIRKYYDCDIIFTVIFRDVIVVKDTFIFFIFFDTVVGKF